MRRPLLVAAIGAGTLLMQACFGAVGNLMARPYDAGGEDDMSAAVDMGADLASPPDLGTHD